jgi:hypothetical protein
MLELVVETDVMHPLEDLVSFSFDDDWPITAAAHELRSSHVETLTHCRIVVPVACPIGRSIAGNHREQPVERIRLSPAAQQLTRSRIGIFQTGDTASRPAQPLRSPHRGRPPYGVEGDRRSGTSCLMRAGAFPDPVGVPDLYFVPGSSSPSCWLGPLPERPDGDAPGVNDSAGRSLVRSRWQMPSSCQDLGVLLAETGAVAPNGRTGRARTGNSWSEPACAGRTPFCSLVSGEL